MLKDTNSVASIAVKDLDRARRFYEGTLGLTPIDSEDDEVIVYRSGNTQFNVYRSEFAGTNQATAMGWSVGEDVEDVARELKSKGVTFEHYDMPELRQEGDVYRNQRMKTAWFKDPDGNILNIVNR